MSKNFRTFFRRTAGSLVSIANVRDCKIAAGLSCHLNPDLLMPQTNYFLIREERPTSLVAFDSYVNDNSIVANDWLTLRFFALVGNQLGAGINLDSMVLEATATPSPTNVYTVFLAYYHDFGWPGIVFFSTVAGFITTWIFRSATREDHQFGVLYGLVFAALLVTSANELFYTSISYWIQAFVFTFIFFKLPDIMTRQRTADISGSMNKPIIGQAG